MAIFRKTRNGYEHTNHPSGDHFDNDGKKRPLTLKAESLIGKGSERFCFIHPEDSSKVIKVNCDSGKFRDQNTIEKIYYKYLIRKNVSPNHFPRFLGTVQTSMGEGLMFDRVESHGKDELLTLEEVVKQNILNYQEVRVLVNNLYQDFYRNSIVFADGAFSNIVCIKNREGDWSLMVIDGLGARHLGIKFWLYRHVPFYARYKIKRIFTNIFRELKIRFG